MYLYVNGKFVELEENETTDSVKEKYKPYADLIILNGYPVSEPVALREGDNVVLIKKSEIPTPLEMEYMLTSRHTPGVYEKLKKSSVVIAGVGGLGSNVAVSLARMGVGRIRFADFDIVEPSNINRQYYFIDQIGMKKVFALYDTLMRINPYLKYEPFDNYLDLSNMYSMFEDFDIIIEAFDKAEEKSKIAGFVLTHFRDKPFIAASGVAGYGDTQEISIKKIKENFYIVGDFKTEASMGMGLMAPRVSVAANSQANLAVRILLGDL